MSVRLPLRALRIAVPAFVLLMAGLLSTCTDGPQPTDLALEPMAMLAVNPVFNPALAVEGSADINRIRITAYLAGTDSIVGQVEVDVDPNATEWTLDVSVVIPSGPNPQVVLTVELVNVTNGQETVQWSGETPPITVTAGTTPQVENVAVVRGPLGNLTVTAISIEEPLLEFLEGESIQVNATATSSDPNVQPEIFWAVLEPGVASISQTGLLTGLMPGSVRVVATAGAVADTASTVVRAKATGVDISPDGALLQSLGEEVQFLGSVVDPRGDAIQGEAVSWGLESSEILEDLGNGLYRSLSRGSTVVTATSVTHPTLTASVSVEVVQAVSAVDVTPETQTLNAKDETAQFDAQALDANGNEIEGMTFTWSSSSQEVATVDQTGMATAVGSGTATIFAETTSTSAAVGTQEAPTPGTVGSATLVVEQSVHTVQVTPNPHTFTALNDVQLFTAAALDANGNVVPGTSFTWSTGDEKVVTVDATGSATAVGPGVTTVTANTGGSSGSADVSVQPEISSVTVTPPTHAFSALQETQEFKAEAKDANGNPIPDAIFAWSSSNPSIASVDDEGLVTALANGTVTITAKSADETGSAEITVSQLAVAMLWVSQPQNAVAGEPLIPAPSVEALDKKGFLVPAFDGLVRAVGIVLAPPTVGSESAFSLSQTQGLPGAPVPFGGTLEAPILGGDTEVAAVSGVATFSNLFVINPGLYSLEAQSNGLTSIASNSFAVADPSVDISMTKVVDNATPSEGDTVTFDVTVTNLGPGDATGVEVQDVASEGLEYVSHTLSQGVLDIEAQLWDVGALASGQTATFQVKILVENGTAGTTLTNEVFVSAVDQTDPVPANNSAEVSVNPVGLDIAVSKSVDDPNPSEGWKIVYTVVVENLGPAHATNVIIRDTIPTGLALDSVQTTSGGWDNETEEWTIPSLAPGTTATIRFFVTVGPGMGGQFRQNEAQRTHTDQTDTNPPNDVALVSITVAQPDLEVAKTVMNTPIGESDPVQFQIKVTYLSGNSPATGIQVQDVLPPGLTFVSETLSQGVLDNVTGIWDVGELLVQDDVATMTITATADPGTAGSSLTNTATLLAVDQGDSNPGNNSASDAVSVVGVDVSVAKTVSAGTYTAGDTVEFKVAVGLTGGVTGTNIQITDAIPTGTSFISYTATSGAYDDATGVWTIPSKAPATPLDTLYLKVAILPGAITVTNTASLFWVDQTDTNGANDSGTVVFAIEKPEVGITKTVGVTDISEGDQVAFTITVTNNDGSVRAIDPVVHDPALAGFTYDFHSQTQGAYDNGTGDWLVGTLAPGGTATLSLNLTADAGTAGTTLTNTADVVSTYNGDDNPANNSATATVNVHPLPEPISYNTPGNTELIAGAYAVPSTPHHTDVRTLIGTTPSLVVTSVGTFATTNGGSVTIEADGDFSYTPFPGNGALDQFTYTVNTGESAVVDLTKEDMVWYVDNSAVPLAGTGVSNDPFATLGEAATAQAASAPPAPTGAQPSGGPALSAAVPETVFFLHAGNSQTPGSEYDGNFALGTNERLQGEGAGLSLASFPNLIPVGPTPVKTNTAGDAVSLGSGSTLRGVDIDSPTGSSLFANGANGATVDQVNITGGVGIGLHNTEGTLNFTDVTVTDVSNTSLLVEGGTPVLNFQGSLVHNATNSHLHLFRILNTTGGSVTLSGGPFTDASSGLGSVIIDGATGTVDVTMPVTVNEAGGPGILVQNSSAPVSFASVDIINTGTPGLQVDNNTAGVTFNSVTISTNMGVGITSTNNPGAFTINGGTVNTTDATAIIVDITPFYGTFSSVTNLNNTATGAGLYLNQTTPGSLNIGLLDVTTSGADGGMYLANAGTVNVTNGASSITANGVPGIRVDNTILGMTFADVSASTPAPAPAAEGISPPSASGAPTGSGGAITLVAPAPTAEGISLIGASGTLTINGGTITTPAAAGGTGVRLSGGNVDLSFGGTITNTRADAWAVQVGNRTGGNTGFTGLITGSGRGVQIGGTLGANIDGVVKFSGGLDLTGAGESGVAPFYAFSSTNNGQVEVIGANNTIAPASPSLDGTPGLEITNTTIGPGGVTFKSISSTGNGVATNNGIKLQNTGAGSFTITGDGSTASSGGTIQNIYGDGTTTGHGILLSGVQDVDLSFMDLNWMEGHGIDASNLTNFALKESTVDSAGRGSTAQNGLDFNGLYGTGLLQNTTIQDARADCVAIWNTSGTLDFDIDGSTLNTCGDTIAGQGVNLWGGTSAVVTVDVLNGSTISNASRDGIYAVVGGTADVTVNVDATGGQNNFTNNGNYGIRHNTSSTGKFALNVLAGGVNQNVFDGNTWPIHSYQTDGASVKFDINGNQFSNGMILAQFLVGESSTADASLEGQFTNNIGTGFSGAQILNFQVDGNATGAVKVDGNDLTSSASSGAGIQAGAGMGGDVANSQLDYTLTNNEVDLAGSTGESLVIQSSLNSLLCTNINNNFQGSLPTGGGDYDIGLDRAGTSRFWLEDHIALGVAPTDSEVGAYINDQNGGAIGVDVNSADRVEGVAPGTCLLPFTAAPSGTADIDVRKTAEPSTGGQPGGPLTYTVVVKNRGSGTATGVVVGDSVRPARTVVWTPSQGTFSPGNPGDTIWNVGSLAPGDSAVMTSTGTISAAEENWAWLKGLIETDPNAANDTAQATVTLGLAEAPEPAPDPENPPESDPHPDQPPKPESPEDQKPWLDQRPLLPDETPLPREGSGPDVTG